VADIDLSLDRSDMLGWLADYPRQLRELYPAGHRAGREAARTRADAGRPFSAVLVLGTGGGSAAAAYVVLSLTRGRLTVPFDVCQGYDPPCYASAAVGRVGPGGASGPRGRDRAGPVLVVAVSHSGETEETLTAYDALRAGAADPAVVAVTGGGRLAREAARDGHPLVAIPTGMQARAAFPGILAALLGVLDGAGLTAAAADFRAEVEEAAALLADLARAWGPDAPAPPALALARETADRLLIVYGGAGPTEGVARRWKNQLAENGKTLAHWYTVPEAHHDEVVGFDAPAALRERLHVCLLRDDAGESPKMKKRLDVTRRLLSGRVAGVTEVEALGRSPLARALSLCLYGDYLSCYVALLRGIDPTPVPVIVELKKVMAGG
jgi:glucose/mannose-6-phosphate isomerase